MGRGRTVRWFAMWAAGVVLVLSVAAWGVSLFRLDCPRLFSPTLNVRLNDGELGVYLGRNARPKSFRGFRWSPRWWPEHGFVDWIRRPDGSVWWSVVVPLWMPAMISGLVLWSVRDGAGKRREDNTRCPTCGYDLTGIDGVCPECGSER